MGRLARCRDMGGLLGLLGAASPCRCLPCFQKHTFFHGMEGRDLQVHDTGSVEVGHGCLLYRLLCSLYAQKGMEDMKQEPGFLFFLFPCVILT